MLDAGVEIDCLTFGKEAHQYFQRLVIHRPAIGPHGEVPGNLARAGRLLGVFTRIAAEDTAATCGVAGSGGLHRTGDGQRGDAGIGEEAGISTIHAVALLLAHEGGSQCMQAGSNRHLDAACSSRLEHMQARTIEQDLDGVFQSHRRAHE